MVGSRTRRRATSEESASGPARTQLNTLLHQVDIGVVHRHVHPDGRIAAAEFHQRRQDALAAEVVRARDAHLAARFGAQQLHAADAVVGLVQQALAMDAERFAGRRQAEAAGAALGQRHAQLGFERADVVADHGAGQPQRARRRRQSCRCAPRWQTPPSRAIRRGWEPDRS
jgi:hypothetical protein